MRGILLLTIVVLLFIVHTARGYYDTEDIDLSYITPYRRVPQKKVPTSVTKPTPKKPVTKSTPKKLVTKSTPKKIVTKSTPKKIVTKSTPKKLVTNSTPKKPTTKPSTNKTPTKTSTKKTPTKTSTKKTPTKTSTKKTPTKTSTKKTPTKTSTKKTPTKTSTKKTPTKTSTKKTIKTKPTATTPTRTFMAVFSKLEGYQVGAVPTSEESYQWVARVIHSRTRDTPHMCTAICIDKAIFITAARCILYLKVEFTTVKLLDTRYYAAKSFVTPSKPTRQYHEDIGFIVVDGAMGTGEIWNPIEIELIKEKRTDKEFRWFSNYLSRTKGVYKVVGYAAKKYYHKIRTPDLPIYDLCQLDIHLGHDFCVKIMSRPNVVGFQVPCYMPCTYKQYEDNLENSGKLRHPQCKRYHGVEGGAVINTVTNKLVGVATWGAFIAAEKDPNPNEELPVGFAIPNSGNFIMDYNCAKKIRNSPKTSNYEQVCS